MKVYCITQVFADQKAFDLIDCFNSVPHHVYLDRDFAMKHYRDQWKEEVLSELSQEYSYEPIDPVFVQSEVDNMDWEWKEYEDGGASLQPDGPEAMVWAVLVVKEVIENA